MFLETFPSDELHRAARFLLDYGVKIFTQRFSVSANITLEFCKGFLGQDFV